eukprot:XP_001702164.1 predicted protein [Chlamydomonas reinhardtii]
MQAGPLVMTVVAAPPPHGCLQPDSCEVPAGNAQRVCRTRLWAAVSAPAATVQRSGQ